MQQRTRADLGEEERRALEEALDLIPRGVRDKLDRVGVKLHLAEWQMLSLEERRRLHDQPCDSEAQVGRYRTDLETLVRERCGKAVDKLSG